ncbi:aldose 1-epimerase-like isoform X2 [Melanaphis sacchari]|uniref:aldose 1-epimerase-like isoform X2 n=1 Tax=Melanaphis sacchari TaxID=742174 RepID=UPI000DC14062|nr:aldose 1-epimerase-like isoform X2 [Melanaphis sacchari]
MNNSKKLSSEAILLNPISNNIFNDLIYETEEQKKSIHDTDFIIVDDYGCIKDDNGQNIKVTKYTLKNEQKVVIEIINYGATVVSCWVPNALGVLEDVLLGFDSIEGRVTDYITNGHLENDKGEIYELNKNRNGHHFNGGEKGFDKVMWDGFVSDDELVLTYSSKDGEEGYPGTFQARITFRLTCKNELVVDYVGMTSKSTPVNMASNMFFNLAGQNTGESELMHHSIMVNAEEYMVIKEPERRPVGLIKNVHRTCLDLRVPRLLKKAFPIVPGYGYNHTFKLFKGKERKAFNLAVSLVHKKSGRMLDIYTDMPCIYINTAQDFPNYGTSLFKEEVMKVTNIEAPLAKFDKYENEQDSVMSDEYKFESDVELIEEENNLEYEMKTLSQINHIQEIKPIKGKSNTIYSKHSGVCIRPQLFPDAVTHKNFKSIILKPSNMYSQQVIYKFGVIVSTD